MGALHIGAKATDHIKRYRTDPAYWRNQSNLQQSTSCLWSGEYTVGRRDVYGFDDLVPDDSDEDNDASEKKQRYDPFNPDWPKKETDLTDEQNLFSRVFSTRARL